MKNRTPLPAFAKIKWHERARRTLYTSEWILLHQLDLELPDGTLARDIHLVDYPYPAASVVPADSAGNLLLIDHYRFQTQTR